MRFSVKAFEEEITVQQRLARDVVSKI